MEHLIRGGGLEILGSESMVPKLFCSETIVKYTALAGSLIFSGSGLGWTEYLIQVWILKVNSPY